MELDHRAAMEPQGLTAEQVYNAYVNERRTAGRDIPNDVWYLMPKAIDEILAERAITFGSSLQVADDLWLFWVTEERVCHLTRLVDDERAETLFLGAIPGGRYTEQVWWDDRQSPHVRLQYEHARLPDPLTFEVEGRQKVNQVAEFRRLFRRWAEAPLA